MTGAILVVNAGSSSVKFSLFGGREDLPVLAQGQVSDLGGAPVFTEAGTTEEKALPAGSSHEQALSVILGRVAGLTPLAAAAHRVVHGGAEFTGPVRISAPVLERLRALVPLAPLHQPHNIAAIEVIGRLMPALPQIACFDTAFHAAHDPLFSLYALPAEFAQKGVRRYGFHGLSYAWIAQELERSHPRLFAGRVVACHLGSGASLCALRGGRSIDTTMGMTALEGLPMGTRCGNLDPGAVIYMTRELGIPPERVEQILYQDSGLKGLSGVSNDVRRLLESKDPRAAFALDFFCLKTAQHIAMMSVSLGGLDGIVFTGGIGENAVSLREKITGYLAFLRPFDVLVVPANEERVMAAQAQAILNTASAAAREAG
jgi:acetate kinase